MIQMKKMPNYGDKNYWIQRYEEQNGTTFDWLEDYESVKPILKNLERMNDPKKYGELIKEKYNEIKEIVDNKMAERIQKYLKDKLFKWKNKIFKRPSHKIEEDKKIEKEDEKMNEEKFFDEGYIFIRFA